MGPAPFQTTLAPADGRLERAAADERQEARAADTGFQMPVAPMSPPWTLETQRKTVRQFLLLLLLLLRWCWSGSAAGAAPSQTDLPAREPMDQRDCALPPAAELP